MFIPIKSREALTKEIEERIELLKSSPNTSVPVLTLINAYYQLIGYINAGGLYDIDTLAAFGRGINFIDEQEYEERS